MFLIGIDQLLMPDSEHTLDKVTSLFDPSKESISFGGQTFNLQNSNIHLHFESYLNSQQYKQKEAQVYYNNLKTISALLTPNASGTDRTAQAFQLLKDASPP